jgi:hypothetical protein
MPMQSARIHGRHWLIFRCLFPALSNNRTACCGTKRLHEKYSESLLLHKEGYADILKLPKAQSVTLLHVKHDALSSG